MGTLIYRTAWIAICLLVAAVVGVLVLDVVATVIEGGR